MGSESRRPAFTAAVSAVVVIALLLAGGLYIRTIIAQSFTTVTDLSAIRTDTYSVLRYQVDEETGVRGFVATKNRAYLDPYLRGKTVLVSTIMRIRAGLPGLGLMEAAPAVDELAIIARDYANAVAGPLINTPGVRTDAVMALGKQRVDRFRSDVRSIVRIIDAHRDRAIAGVQQAIDRIGLLVGGAIAVVLLISILSGANQARLSRRLEAERAAADEERRDADILRSAYLAEKRIADTLQEAFVQRPLPTHPTLRFSATYVPASEEAKVGGDWYDALELPGNRVLFAIGDVTGHGIEAAVTMNRVRQTLISSALLDPMPDGLLRRVAQELYAGKAPLVTAVAGFADANTYEFVYATAGHPPPILIEPGRAPRMLDCGSLPLGALAENDYESCRIQSVPGAMLVLYTDGAVEHSRDVIEGEEILLAAAAELARIEPPDPATFIHNAVFRGRPIGDDVAILTIGFAAEPAAGMRISADNAQGAFSGRLGTLSELHAESERPVAALPHRVLGMKAA